MSICFFSFDGVHLVGHSAAHPIEPLATRQGALLLLAPQCLSVVVGPRSLLRHAGRSHATRLTCFKPSKRVQARLERAFRPTQSRLERPTRERPTEASRFKVPIAADDPRCNTILLCQSHTLALEHACRNVCIAPSQAASAALVPLVGGDLSCYPVGYATARSPQSAPAAAAGASQISLQHDFHHEARTHIRQQQQTGASI